MNTVFTIASIALVATTSATNLTLVKRSQALLDADKEIDQDAAKELAGRKSCKKIATLIGYSNEAIKYIDEENLSSADKATSMAWYKRTLGQRKHAYRIKKCTAGDNKPKDDGAAAAAAAAAAKKAALLKKLRAKLAGLKKTQKKNLKNGLKDDAIAKIFRNDGNSDLKKARAIEALAREANSPALRKTIARLIKQIRSLQ